MSPVTGRSPQARTGSAPPRDAMPAVVPAVLINAVFSRKGPILQKSDFISPSDTLIVSFVPFTEAFSVLIRESPFSQNIRPTMIKTPLSLTTLSFTAAVIGSGVHAHAEGLDITPGTHIATLPFSDTGTTVGFTNDINTHGPFSGGYTSSAGPDVIYTFTVATSGLISISYGFGGVGDNIHDAALGLFTGISTEPLWVTGADAEYSGSGNPNEVILNFPVNAGTTYHILLDGYFSTSQGAYTLSVTGAGGLALSAAPEPGSALLATAALGTAAWRRRRRGKV